MARRNETDERIELSHALWELRCGIARLGDAEANMIGQFPSSME